MGKIAQAEVGGAKVIVDGGLTDDGASLRASLHLPGQTSEADDVADVARHLPNYKIPDSGQFASMGDALARTVSLEELVLRPGLLATIDDVNAYLSHDVRGDRGLEILNITGGTGNGKTTLAKAIVDEAKSQRMSVMEVSGLNWLSGTRHESARTISRKLDQFVRTVEDSALEDLEDNKPKGVIVVNEAHGVFGSHMRGSDDELNQRAAAFNDFVDRLQKQTGVKILVVFTGRLPLTTDVAARAKWHVELASPDDGQRAEVLYRLLLKEFSMSPENIGTDLVTAVDGFGTLTPEKSASIKQYLAERKAGLTEVNPDLEWTERFYNLINSTNGFSYRDMEFLVANSFDRTRRTPNRQTGFDDFVAVLPRMWSDVRARMDSEEAERRG